MLLAVLGLTSCKKAEKGSSNCKITSVNDQRGSISTYTYDTAGKVSNVTGLYGYGDGIFTYQRGAITFTSSMNEPNKTFYTDHSGRITQYGTDVYKYNTDGYLIEKSLRYYGIVPEFSLSYADGNLVKVDINGKKTAEITYYDEPVQNLLGYETALCSDLLYNDENGFHTMDATFIGKGSRNLVKSITLKHISTVDNNPEQLKETRVYTKDQNGKITLMTITRDVPDFYGPGTSTVSFAYQCQ